MVYVLYELAYTGPGDSADFAVGGGIVGFILSPFLLLGLRKKSVMPGLAAVYGPTFLVALLAGVWARESFVGMYLAHYLPMLSVILMSFVARLALPDAWNHPLHCCQRCGYDLRGLTDGDPCPECGERDLAALDSDSPHDR
ncbi:MAG: hypothetical protein H6813_00920 [Phycisphaeraceae bacterium]|nr:hypothetical protein [Phycisphaeraceae bacterium]MCB9847352.1 hypothetical protein [Phycisphaeraceae bacterium]